MDPAAVQQAVYTVLVSDTVLIAMLSTAWGVDAVFSDTPQENADDGAFYPFVSFGPDITTPFDTKTSAGGIGLVAINAWSRSGDYIEVKNIAARIWLVLHRTPYTITGADLVSSDMESSAFEMDPDGETRRARMQLRVTYETNQNVT